MNAGSYLAVPAAERRHFRRNFISQAVCEIRFPTLFELDRSAPPVALATALRKEFPTYQLVNNIRVESKSVDQSHGHQFQARKNRYSVTVKSSSIALETTHYDDFDDFKSKLAFVIKAARPTIDSDFYTRLGLRYINSLPCPREEIGQWVNKPFSALLASEVFGVPAEFAGRVAGKTKSGATYLLQHGIGTDQKTAKDVYVLDFDFSVEDGSFEDALNAVEELHDEQHSLFRWCLGEKALAWLGSE